MVKNYLEQTREGFIKDRIQLVEQETSLHNHLKENIRFVQLLEETNDPNYESFTPREVNVRNRQKINELEQEQKELVDQINEVRTSISDIDCQINEINSVIKVVKENERPELDNNRFELLETQEKERQRIARDLHDSTVQNLTSLIHKSELCIKLIDLDPIRCKLELTSLNKILRDIIDDTRNIIYDLRPMTFDDIGFDVTVERYLDKLKKSYSNRNFLYKVEGESYKINQIIGITLFRIIQEACNNSIRHGEASNINVLLSYHKDKLLLTVTDDGKGFDISTIPKSSRSDNSGFGLSMMKERIYLLSGTLDIQSELGKGCVVLVEIPTCGEDK